MVDSMQGKDAVEFLESLIVGDVASLEDRTGTLSVFTNDKGGIIDDSVITKVCSNTALCYICCVAAPKTCTEHVCNAVQAHVVLTTY